MCANVVGATLRIQVRVRVCIRVRLRMLVAQGCSEGRMEEADQGRKAWCDGRPQG